MLIADAQLHIWAEDTPARPWPPGRAAEAQKPYPITAQTLLFQMDTAGVTRAVLVPPSFEGDYNDLALDAAQRYPDRFAIMGRLDLEDPASRDRVANWRDQPGMLGMLGMRHIFHNEHNRYLLNEGHADWLWAAAEQAGIPLMLFMPAEAEPLHRIARAHPDLRILIDHVGLDLHLKAPEVFGYLPKICELAQYPNVAVKASGLASLSTTPYPFPDLHQPIRTLYDAFGPQRTFWGTDLTRMPCTYFECIKLFTEHLPWLKGDDLESVMGRGLCDWLGWPI